MIEIMILVRDTATNTSEQHITDVAVDAADLHEKSAEDVWDEITRESRTGVVAATRRLAANAHRNYDNVIPWRNR